MFVVSSAERAAANKGTRNMYEALINYSASKLNHALSRLEYARKYETPVHILKWSFRVEEAAKQFAAAQKAALTHVFTVSQ